MCNELEHIIVFYKQYGRDNRKIIKEESDNDNYRLIAISIVIYAPPCMFT